MTTVATPAVAAPLSLTDKARKAALIRLAKNADWCIYSEVLTALSTLAHPSLSRGRRADLFESLKERLEQLAALRAGLAWPSDFKGEPGAPPGDDPVKTAEYLQDRASEFLHKLIQGEN